MSFVASKMEKELVYGDREEVKEAQRGGKGREGVQEGSAEQKRREKKQTKSAKLEDLQNKFQS